MGSSPRVLSAYDLWVSPLLPSARPTFLTSPFKPVFYLTLLLFETARVKLPDCTLAKVPIKNDVGHFPGGSVVKNPPANAGDTGSSPGLGRSYMLWSN